MKNEKYTEQQNESHVETEIFVSRPHCGDFYCIPGPGNQQGRRLVDSFHGSRVRNDGEAEGRNIVYELHRKGLVGEIFEQTVNK